MGAVTMVAIGLVYVALAFLPLNILLVETLPDDAFYYFQIARHVSEGHGSTFDGTNLTNGYHPLWMLLLVPVFSIFSEGGTFDVAPVHAALVVAVLCAIVTGFFLLSVMRRSGLSEKVSSLLLLLFFFNPFVLYAFLNGLETALVFMLLSLLVLVALQYDEEKSTARIAVIGFVGGLLMLARLDTVFYFLGALAWLAYIHGFPKNMYQTCRPVLVAGVAASLLVVPFLMWNYSTFGMLLTSASVASTEVNRGLTIADNGDTLVTALRAPVYMTLRALGDVLKNTGAPILILLVVGYLIARVRDKTILLVQAPILWFLVAGGAAHLLVSAAARYTWRDWYFVPLNVLFVLLFSYYISGLLTKERFSKWVVAGLLLGVTFSYVVMWERYVQHREHVQADMFAAAQWGNDYLPEESVVGVFNAGIQGYFSRHTVVNLDGLVNNVAAEAIKEKRLWEYALTDAKVTHVADFPIYFEYRFKPFFGTSAPLDGFQELYATSPEGVRVYAR